MKMFKTAGVPACSVIFAAMILLVFCQVPLHAELQTMPPTSQKQLQMQKKPATEPAVIPAMKFRPDLKATLNISKTNTGLVTLNGVITNIGSKDYDVPAEAQFIMNLSLPPKTYNQVGLSDLLRTQGFSQLKKGDSLPISFTYQVPDFDGWVDSAGIMTPDAKRLFTLRVVKKDMSSFAPAEDANPDNNSASAEVGYALKQN